MDGLVRRPGTPTNPGAIHRCVLAGFPSQIGRKGADRHYDGPRGLRFVISPGSSLQRHDPPWVVAAELVETTRLFARAVGRVRPDWVERVAPHLVTREVFEPHWVAASGQVAAWEKVSLHGLTLVPRRRVPFGPIDPKGARDIFIQVALVDEEIRTDGEFLAHNRELIEQLEKIEAKKRARDVLVDLRARFEFYDARVPAEVHSTPSFEKWRRQAERGNPRVLFMSREDLLRPGVGGLSAEDYPDLLDLDGLRLPLDYRHEPGHAEDGVTVTVPLAALGQISGARLEWLVPGMLKEKMVALLRTLPKRQRIRFVPAGEYAEGAAESLEFGVGSLAARLAAHLHRLTGTPVSAADFRLQDVPVHLRMNIHVLDDRGEVIARGRDLAQLRRDLGQRAEESLAAVLDHRRERAVIAPAAGGSAHSGEQSGEQLGAGTSDAGAAGSRAATALPPPPVLPRHLTSMPADPIPEVVSVSRGGMTMRAYPALVDEGKSVGLGLFAEAAMSAEAHRGGIGRLLAIVLGEEIRPMLDFLPQPGGAMGLDALALLHAPYGTRELLERGLLRRTVERAAALGACDLAQVRDAATFSQAKEAVRSRMWEAGLQCVDILVRILNLRLSIDRTLEAPLPSTWEEAVADVRNQMAFLLPPEMLERTPWEHLVHLPRYLQGASIRLQKLREGGQRRDAALMAELRPFLQRVEARRASIAEEIAAPALLADLDRFRWLVEEFRISLFAQDLRTAVPISATRLERAWTRMTQGDGSFDFGAGPGT